MIPRLTNTKSVEIGRDDLDRLRTEYAAREERLAGSDIYSPFNPASLFMVQQRQRAELSLLRRYGFNRLENRRILEVGCGRGRVLQNYTVYGAKPENLHGTDLLLDRLQDAHELLPRISLSCTDGRRLPYADESFDLILQYTVFSSILDDSIKRKLATEMIRILRKRVGMILWYDFWLNPTNKQTRGIRRAEIEHLFPGCRFEFLRITLAPPISRALVPVSLFLADLIERLKLLNSHYLVAIRPV
jgi:SAM-dependent methyltransferase